MNCPEIRHSPGLFNIPGSDEPQACFRTSAGYWSLSMKSVSLPKVVSIHTMAAVGKDGLEVGFEEGAGVLEVFFGVGFGGGDAVKRFVEDTDDALLFGKGRKRTGRTP